MTRFTKGLLTGSAIGFAGLMFALKDRRARKSMIKEGKRVVGKANSMAHNISDMF